MTPVGVFFCWQGGAERDFVNSTDMSRSLSKMFIPIRVGSLEADTRFSSTTRRVPVELTP